MDTNFTELTDAYNKTHSILKSINKNIAYIDDIITDCSAIISTNSPTVDETNYTTVRESVEKSTSAEHLLQMAQNIKSLLEDCKSLIEAT